MTGPGEFWVPVDTLSPAGQSATARRRCGQSAGGGVRAGGHTSPTTNGPVTRTYPETPAAPAGPVGPVGPAGPVGPVGPVGPGTPCALKEKATSLGRHITALSTMRTLPLVLFLHAISTSPDAMPGRASPYNTDATAAPKNIPFMSPLLFFL